MAEKSRIVVLLTVAVFMLCCVFFLCAQVFLMREESISLTSTMHTNSSEHPNYDIEYESFVWNDVNIQYPIVVIEGLPSFSEEINTKIREISFSGKTEQELKTYSGVLLVNNLYEIKLENEKYLSIVFEVDWTQGLSKGIHTFRGITIDMEQKNFLTFSDLGFDLGVIISIIEDDPTKMIEVTEFYETSDGAKELLSGFDVNQTENFYLGNGTIGFILPNRILSRTTTAVVEFEID